MIRFFARPIPLVLFLAFCTFIPVMMALVRTVQIPTGSYPDDSLRLAVAPLAWFLHALAGASFGLAGPLQFVFVLRRHFGKWHRLTGRVFVLSGSFLGLSGLAMLLQVPSQSTAILDVARGVFGFALLFALAQSMFAVLRRDIPRHRAWAIRAYAIGMGSGTIALVFFPIYVITGVPPLGFWADVIYIGWWTFNIAVAEFVIRRTTGKDAGRLMPKPSGVLQTQG
jgi:Predicted membrane protein (DUF2306)